MQKIIEWLDTQRWYTIDRTGDRTAVVICHAHGRWEKAGASLANLLEEAYEELHLGPARMEDKP